MNLEKKNPCFKKLNIVKDSEDTYYDISILVNKENEVIIIDNSEEDYTDLVDCDTKVVFQRKIKITK